MSPLISRLYLCVAVLFLCSCKVKTEQAVSPNGGRNALLSADREFSKMSAAQGMKAAFLEYIDSNGVLLRPEILPLAGADAVDYLISLNDTGFKYQWQPKEAVVAASGELGYTYGTYALTPSMQDTILYGTYVNIWKKNAEGQWKFVLDSGNEGTGGNLP